MNATEKAWLRRARALARAKPKTLRIYVTDSAIVCSHESATVKPRKDKLTTEPETQRDDLLACPLPLCGGHATLTELRYANIGRVYGYVAKCEECGCELRRVPQGWPCGYEKETMEEAKSDVLTLWNTRQSSCPEPKLCRKMNLEQAKNSVGKMVMSRDAGHKLIRSVTAPHGPYRLLQITKAGEAILEGRSGMRVPPSLLELYEAETNQSL